MYGDGMNLSGELGVGSNHAGPGSFGAPAPFLRLPTREAGKVA